MMNSERKKELKEEYKNYKPDMGIYSYTCTTNNMIYIGADQDIKGRINGLNFQLNLGSARYKDLQKDWKEHGEGSFKIEVLELLDYPNNHQQGTDYSEDLEFLLNIWKEKLPAAKEIKA